MNDDLSQSDVHQALRNQLTAVLTDLKDTLQADVVCLFVYDAYTESFHLPIGLGLRDPDSFNDPKMRPRGDRGVAKLVLQNSYLIIDKLDDRPELYAAFAHREHIRSMVGMACIFKESIVGILYVNFRNQHTFNVAETNTLNEYAVQFAELIAASTILQNLPGTPVEPVASEDKILQGIVDLLPNRSNFV